MKIKINGKDFEMEASSTLEAALEKANIKPGGIATALNGVVVPAPMRGKTVLADNDSIIVIKAFYGG